MQSIGHFLKLVLLCICENYSSKWSMIEFDPTFDSSSFAFNLKLIKKNLIVLKKVWLF